MANETVADLTQKNQILEHEKNQPKPDGSYVDLDGGLTFGTSEEYSIGEEDLDVDNSTNKAE
jgi:hypothetical protein